MGYGPVSALVVSVASFFGSQLIVSLLIIVLALVIGIQDIGRLFGGNTAARFVIIASTGLATLFIINKFLSARRVSLSQLGLGKLKTSYLLNAIAGFGVYFLAYVFSVGVLKALVPGLDIDQEQDIGFSTAQSSLGLILVFFSLVIILPLVEEFVMRGFLFTGLRTKLSFAYSTLITSLLFAMAHLPASKDGSLLWIAAIDTFVLSFVLCYLREKTKSLWPPMGLHMLKNSLAFTILFIFGARIG